jgi:hypothetical protein
VTLNALKGRGGLGLPRALSYIARPCHTAPAL